MTQLFTFFRKCTKKNTSAALRAALPPSSPVSRAPRAGRRPSMVEQLMLKGDESLTSLVLGESGESFVSPITLQEAMVPVVDTAALDLGSRQQLHAAQEDKLKAKSQALMSRPWVLCLMAWVHGEEFASVKQSTDTYWKRLTFMQVAELVSVWCLYTSEQFFELGFRLFQSVPSSDGLSEADLKHWFDFAAPFLESTSELSDAIQTQVLANVGESVGEVAQGATRVPLASLLQLSPAIRLQMVMPFLIAQLHAQEQTLGTEAWTVKRSLVLSLSSIDPDGLAYLHDRPTSMVAASGSSHPASPTSADHRSSNTPHSPRSDKRHGSRSRHSKHRSHKKKRKAKKKHHRRTQSHADADPVDDESEYQPRKRSPNRANSSHRTPGAPDSTPGKPLHIRQGETTPGKPVRAPSRSPSPSPRGKSRASFPGSKEEEAAWRVTPPQAHARTYDISSDDEEEPSPAVAQNGAKPGQYSRRMSVAMREQRMARAMEIKQQARAAQQERRHSVDDSPNKTPPQQVPSRRRTGPSRPRGSLERSESLASILQRWHTQTKMEDA